MTVLHIGQQSAQFRLDHGVAFARPGLKACPIEYRDVATSVVNETGVLQLSAGFVEKVTEWHRDPFQMSGQALEFRRGQGGEKMVLIRTLG